ncbi:MAG: ribosome small subunit-dependent GTPase A [Chloroflexaceae bacterium]|nr:ribosome small subunit-dependent GTPase A [Chloroflexaceae bacterium]
MQGKVLRAQSGFFWVQTDEGILECRLRGRLKKERQQSDIVVIGDDVEVMRVSPEQGAIESVYERRSRFSRRQPGSRGQWKEDILIANVDQVVLVFACANPPMKPRLLDRFLVIAEYNEIAPVIVANKVDLVGSDQVNVQFAPYQQIGYPVLSVSARQGSGIEALRDRLEGCISVLTGPSGVGKSSLLNALQPELALQEGSVSTAVNKGRHTTVVAELHPLGGPAGGYVADTPGLRELAAWLVPQEELAWCFPEMRPFLGACDFHNCLHTHEPGCAVRQAVAEQTITQERYESYVRQLRNDER